ncbi:MAG: extracellular solute-binding protein [Patescibacteria group bacterium]
MSKFQVIVIGIIIGLVTLAVLVLSGALPGLPGRQTGPVVQLTLWGPLPNEEMVDVIKFVNDNNQKNFSIKYFEKDELIYENELVHALANDAGPDMWFLTQDMLLKNREKVYLIPYSVFSERSYKDMFIDVADLYLWEEKSFAENEEKEEGIVALPVVVDPIVLYWNKDLFNNAGIVEPPRFWDSFLAFSQALTKKDQVGNILQSGVAFGEFANVNNAKDIMSMLILQGGNDIVDASTLDVVIDERGDSPVGPAVSALSFFTSFSNPTKLSYSWNRALAESKNMFVSGNLAMYFGYASEFDDIEQSNPHLNFDVALVPKSSELATASTFGKVHAIAVSKRTNNLNKSIEAIFNFMSNEVQTIFAENLSVAPVVRDALSLKDLGAIRSVFYKSAIQARSWLEPDPIVTSILFKEMISSVVTGRRQSYEAIGDIKTLLQEEMEKIK